MAMLQLSALMARFALPMVGVLFPLLVWAAWSLLPRRAPILLLLLLLVVGQIGFWYPDNLRVLPEPLTARLHPGPVKAASHLEADLRYQDAIELLCWTGRQITHDATARGLVSLPGVASRWPVTAALSDPDLGYVDAPMPTLDIRSWQDVDVDLYPYVVVVDGLPRIPPFPPPGLFTIEPVASRRAGELQVHIWYAVKSEAD
ncbi:MAG: hypothetical protein ABIF77_17060 [bacterium]